eukprot:6470811-Amphidinium_carterae.1
MSFARDSAALRLTSPTSNVRATGVTQMAVLAGPQTVAMQKQSMQCKQNDSLLNLLNARVDATRSIRPGFDVANSVRLRHRCRWAAARARTAGLWLLTVQGGNLERSGSIDN